MILSRSSANTPLESTSVIDNGNIFGEPGDTLTAPTVLEFTGAAPVTSSDTLFFDVAPGQGLRIESVSSTPPNAQDEIPSNVPLLLGALVSTLGVCAATGSQVCENGSRHAADAAQTTERRALLTKWRSSQFSPAFDSQPVLPAFFSHPPGQAPQLPGERPRCESPKSTNKTASSAGASSSIRGSIKTHSAGRRSP